MSDWSCSGHLTDLSMAPREACNIVLHHVALTVTGDRTVRCVALSNIEGVLRVPAHPSVVALIIPKELDLALYFPTASKVDVMLSYLRSLLGTKGGTEKTPSHLIVYEESELSGHVRLTPETQKLSVTLSLPHSRLDLLRLASNRSVVSKLTSEGDQSVEFSDRVQQVLAFSSSHDPNLLRVLILSERAIYVTDKVGKILQRSSFNAVQRATLYLDDAQCMSIAVKDQTLHFRAKFAKDFVMRLKSLHPSLNVTKAPSATSLQDEPRAESEDEVDALGTSLTVEEDPPSGERVGPVQTLRPSPPPAPVSAVPSSSTQEKCSSRGVSGPTTVSPPLPPPTRDAPPPSLQLAVSEERYRSIQEQMQRLIESKDALSREVLIKGEELSKKQKENDDLIIQISSLQQAQRVEEAYGMFSNRELQVKVQELCALLALREAELEDAKKGSLGPPQGNPPMKSAPMNEQQYSHVSEKENQLTPKHGTTPRRISGTTPNQPMRSKSAKGTKVTKTTPKAARTRSQSPPPATVCAIPMNNESTKQKIIDRLRLYIRALERKIRHAVAKDLQGRVENLEQLLEEAGGPGSDVARLKYHNGELEREIQAIREENKELRKTLPKQRAAFEPIFQQLTQRTKDALLESQNELTATKVQLSEAQQMTNSAREQLDKVMLRARADTEEIERRVHREASRRSNDAEQRLRALEEELKQRDIQLDEIGKAVLHGPGHTDALRLHQARSLQELSCARMMAEQEVRSLARQCDDLRRLLHGTSEEPPRPPILDVVSHKGQLPTEYCSVLDSVYTRLREQEDTIKQLRASGDAVALKAELDACRAKVASQHRVLVALQSIGDVDLAASRIAQLEQYAEEADAMRCEASKGEQELHSLREQLKRFEESHEENLKSILAKASASETEGVKVREDLQKAKSEFDEIKAKESRTRKRNAELNQQVSQLKCQVETLKAQAEDGKGIQEKLAIRTKDLTEALRELKSMRTRNEELNRQIAENSVLNTSSVLPITVNPSYTKNPPVGGSSPQSPPDESDAVAAVQKQLSESRSEVQLLRKRVSLLEAALNEVKRKHPDLKLEVEIAIETQHEIDKDLRVYELEEEIEALKRKSHEVKLESERHRNLLEYKLRGAMEQLRTVREAERVEDYRKNMQDMTDALASLQAEVRELREKEATSAAWMRHDAAHRHVMYEDREKEILKDQQRHKLEEKILIQSTQDVVNRHRGRSVNPTSPATIRTYQPPSQVDDDSYFGDYASHHHKPSTPGGYGFQSASVPPTTRVRSTTPKSYSERLERNIEEAKLRGSLLDQRSSSHGGHFAKK